MDDQRSLLKAEGPDKLITYLKAWHGRGHGSKAAKKVISTELGYFERNRDRMDYPRYIAEGLPIGTGAVEGACNHLIKKRFNGGGMRWKMPPAEPVIHLRAAVLSHPHIDLRPYAMAV